MNILKPNRVSHTCTQHLAAPPSAVFPLLCPVREADWIEDWDPELVVSVSGLAEPDCVFVTGARPAASIWYITRHDQDAGLVEMIRITPGVTACRLSILLQPAVDGCEARVTYTHTSLGPQGDQFIAAFTGQYYEQFMRDWETKLNHYLRYGSAVTGARG